MDFPIWVSFLFSILIGHVDRTTAQNDFCCQKDYWETRCFGVYTQNSGYLQNLDDVLNSLNGKNNGFGFYKSTSGQAQAAALCRGDIKPEDCRRCVDLATCWLRQVCLPESCQRCVDHATCGLQQVCPANKPICPNNTEAFIWYDDCFLGYLDRSIESGVDFSVNGSNPINISDSSLDQWNKAVTQLLGRLRQEAAGGGKLRKYASGDIPGPENFTIYGIMQCTPDLSAQECDQCLARATTDISLTTGSLGFRVHKPSCFLRYENYSFFGPTWYPPPSEGPNIWAIVGPTLAAAASVAAVIFFIFRIRHKRKRKAWSTNDSPEESKHRREEDDIGEMNYFNLSTILIATNNFSLENKLGEDGFGPVYRGKLQDGKEIAVKRLSRNSGQGLVEFKTEVQLIIKLQHKNLVRLLGYCVEGTERLLIYEFMANNSLDTFLFDPEKCKELDWATRANIVSGIAKGLRYLHEDSGLKIIHRDMKASNILLDNEMNSKISDFGTARIFGGNQMEANTSRIIGTNGYMAPEYAIEGLFSTKSDVYSFGVLLLEIISGQRNNKFYHQDQPQNFLLTAYRIWKENKGEEFIDRRLLQNCLVGEALRWINVALLCVQEDPQDRPTISTIVLMLEDQWGTDLPIPSVPPLSFARFAAVSDQTRTTDGETAHPSTDLASSPRLLLTS